MPPIYYKRLVEGITVPAIIHNINYHYINMPVYEDGSVDCWRRVGIEGFEAELAKGWLATSVPAGQELSIFGLGSYLVEEAAWEYTPESYATYILNCVHSMNQEMVGLFHETAQQREKWQAHRVSWGTRATPYKLKGSFGYSMVDGDSTSLFLRQGEAWQLSSVTVYEDSSLAVEGMEGLLAPEDVQSLFAQGELTGCIEDGARILIPGFGWLRAIPQYQTEPGEKQKEIWDMLAKATGEETSLEVCRDRYVAYLIYPCEDNRERLRAAYEAVPEHERMYLGDMDTKDWDYRRILYHPDKKREV